MKLWVKIGLFLSSYMPLFLILTVKNWFNLPMSILFVFVSLYSLILIYVIQDSKKNPESNFKVLNFENKTKETLNYLAPYIIAFMSFNLNKLQDWIALGLFFSIIFLVYLNSDLIYINPLLLLRKYKVFKVEICKPAVNCDKTKNEIIIITKNEKIKKHEHISIKEIDKGVFLEGE